MSAYRCGRVVEQVVGNDCSDEGWSEGVHMSEKPYSIVTGMIRIAYLDGSDNVINNGALL